MNFVRYSLWVLALGTSLAACTTDVDPDPVATSTDSLSRARWCAGPRDLECREGQFCGGILGLCPSERFYGVCRPEPEACPDIFDPVCGCDGNTYSNRCYAHAAGVSADHAGECERTTGPACGGFPGTPCPGQGDCVDDPEDECDPEQGGADCGGLCECNAIGLCVEGHRWDSSPFVCGCVPEANPCSTVLCPPDTQCVVEDGNAVCKPSAGEACGDTVCGPGLECCNASCGICTPPDGVCIQIACD
jgi:hypothetical protein